jgi:hypothetical protein
LAHYNLETLKKAEEDFFDRYPGGFNHPDHGGDQEKAQYGEGHRLRPRSWFTKEAITRPQEYADNMVKLLTKSSMVSLFEKPKFRDFVKGLCSLHEKEALALGLHNFLLCGRGAGLPDDAGHSDSRQVGQVVGDLLLGGLHPPGLSTFSASPPR